MSAVTYQQPSPPATVPFPQYEKVCRERDQAGREVQQLRQERNEARRETQQLRRERTECFAALTNSSLTIDERFDGLLTLFDAYNNSEDGTQEGGYRPICIRAIASRAARSDDAVSKSIDRLAGYGLWEKRTITSFDSETRQPMSRVLLRTPGDKLHTLHALARLAPTKEERGAVTEEKEGKARTKPGGKRIKRTCPDCGSENTELRCRDCGSIHHTDQLLGDNEGPLESDPDQGPATCGSRDPDQTGATSHGFGEEEPRSRDPQSAVQYTYIPGPQSAAPETVDQGPGGNGPRLAKAQGPASCGTERNGSRTPNLSVLPTSETTLLEAALAYASIGWAVFPLNGKKPLTAHGLKDASTDPDVIRRWWTRWPRANIGLACGPSGIVVLDADPPKEPGEADGVAAMGDLERQLRLPPTLLARSGRRGVHRLYLALPHVALGNSTGKLPAGVHIRGVGGYLVLPPSLHPETGKPYEWVLESRAQIAPFPRVLLPLIVPPPRRPRSSSRGTYALVTTGPPILEGSRNEKLFRLAAGWRGQGAGEDEIVDALLEANDNRCWPRLEEAEVTAIARGVADRYPAGGGGRDSMSAGDTQGVPEPSPNGHQRPLPVSAACADCGGVPCRCPADDDGVIRPCASCGRDFASVGGRTHCPLCPEGGAS